MFETMKDVDEELLKRFFCLCIHRLYPGRPQTTDNPPKTFEELETIMLANKEACRITGSTISPKDIYFFDDMVPRHRIETELKDHYFQVLPYKRNRTNIERLKASDKTTFQRAISMVRISAVSGGYYNYTMKNRIKQKKQQRKHKYSKRTNRKK